MTCYVFAGASIDNMFRIPPLPHQASAPWGGGKKQKAWGTAPNILMHVTTGKSTLELRSAPYSRQMAQNEEEKSIWCAPTPARNNGHPHTWEQGSIHIRSYMR